MATGIATINFGPSTARLATASVNVTGLSGLTSTSYLEAWPMAEATTAHTADVVRVDEAFYCCQFLTSTSFRVHGTIRRGHSWGDRKVRWATV